MEPTETSRPQRESRRALRRRLTRATAGPAVRFRRFVSRSISL